MGQLPLSDETLAFLELFPAFSRQRLVAQLGRLSEPFAFAVSNDLVRIQTPFVYRDGDSIDLYLLRWRGQTVLTDHGGTLMNQFPPGGEAPKVDEGGKLLTDLRLTYGVQYDRGKLFLVLERLDDLPRAIVQLCQAATAFDLLLPMTALLEACQDGLEWIRQARRVTGPPLFQEDRHIEDVLAEAIVYAGAEVRDLP